MLEYGCREDVDIKYNELLELCNTKEILVSKIISSNDLVEEINLLHFIYNNKFEEEISLSMEFCNSLAIKLQEIIESLKSI